MALTSRQSQALWRQHNQTRSSFYKKYVRDFRKLYALQGDSFLEAYKNTGTIVPEDLMPLATQALFVDLYVETGTDFAVIGVMSIKAVDPVVLSWEQQMASYALNECAQSLASIKETNFLQAQSIIRQTTASAIEQGLGTDATARLIEKNILQEWRRYAKFSSERIARTEVIAASNRGAVMGAESTGLRLRKIWLTALDDRERTAHRDMMSGDQANGIPMNEPFIVGGEALMQPGDKAGTPGNVINCRCAVSFLSDLTR
jgi:hypothetical protein